MTRSSVVRLWWAAPGALLAGSAIGAAIVVGPTLGERVAVPSKVSVPGTPPTVVDSTRGGATARPHPPASRPSPTPTAAPSTHSLPPQVVQPRHAIVTAPANDDGRHDTGGQDESGDR